jgi:uncharacterized membrane protein YhaH (DUF805 family)
MSTQSPAKEFLAVFLTIVAAVLVATALFFFGTKIIISQLTDPRRRSDFYNPLIDLFGLSCFFVLTAALFDVFFLALMPRRLRSISLIAVLSIVCGVAVVIILNSITMVIV